MRTLLWILAGVCIVCALVLAFVGVSMHSKQTKEENTKKTEKARAARWKDNGASEVETKPDNDSEGKEVRENEAS